MPSTESQRAGVLSSLPQRSRQLRILRCEFKAILTIKRWMNEKS